MLNPAERLMFDRTLVDAIVLEERVRDHRDKAGEQHKADWRYVGRQLEVARRALEKAHKRLHAAEAAQSFSEDHIDPALLAR